MKYEISLETAKRISDAFTYHKPKSDQPFRYNDLRDSAHDLALKIVTSTPPSREQDLAIDRLGEAIMHANAAIARHEDD
jgi:hypothetical protein